MSCDLWFYDVFCYYYGKNNMKDYSTFKSNIIYQINFQSNERDEETESEWVSERERWGIQSS